METLGILIIEGKSGLARALLAGRPGFRIVHAERMAKAEALAIPARAAGGFAAIVIDLSLPDCQGREAYRRAAALLPGTPMVALLRDAEPDLAETLIAEGAQACLEHEGLDGSALASAVRQAVARRRAELKRFRSLFDAAPMGILLAAGRRVLLANAAAQEILGYDEEGFAAFSVLEPFPPAARPILEGALDAPAPADARFSADLVRRDGSLARCRVHMAAATLNDAPVAALFLTPLAGEDAASPGAASDGASHTGPARQARKMEALGRFAEGVAHDFANLLTAINGHSEHLLTLSGGAGPLAGGLRSIHRAGEQAADLARKLHSLTGADGGEAAPVAVDAALRDMEPVLRRMLGPEIDLRMEARAGAAAVMLEPGRLDQIILSLCANARDAMPQGGVLRVAAEAVEIDPATRFTHLAAGPGPAVAIRVEDEGSGMGPETLERLFEPFYSTKRGGRGKGTSLTAVYGIVEKAGGGIEVESAPGSGSRFRVLFPRVAVPAAQAEAGLASAGATAKATEPARAPQAAPDPSAPEGATVLVVEDEPSLREMIQAILARSGYAVLAAGSVEEAERIAAERGGEIDLIVTDVMLRGDEGGDGLAARLQTLRPGLRALFISGHPLEILAERGIHVPEDAFLEKPFTPSRLALRVRALLEASRKPG